MHKQLSVLAVEHPLERHALNLLLALLGVLFVAYLYFVGASVLNIISRKEAVAQAAQLQGHISSMEQSYFNLSQSLSPAMAPTLGLTHVEETHYVYRPGNTASAVTPSKSGI